MPPSNRLTDPKIRNAKPKEKPYRLTDGKGLYIEVAPSGSRLWRLKYRMGGKEKRLALGRYPEVTLKKARQLRDEARELIAEGTDPSAHRKRERQRKAALSANSFEVVARDWLETHQERNSKGHRDRIRRCLERDIFPYLGATPVSEVTAADIRDVVDRVHRRGIAETARRVHQYTGQVIRYAISRGLAHNDPSQALRGFLPKRETRHMAASTDPLKVGELLRMTDAFKGGPVVAVAIRLLPLLFVRPGELRTMRWEDVDLEQAEWRYVTSKTRTPHLVPLSSQALALLQDIHPLTGHLPGGWVFPGGRSPMRPMSNGAINAAYRSLNIDTRNDLTAHGWRAIARTLLAEVLEYPPEVIEHQLAHAVPDMLGRAYNRTRYIEKRREMMQAWADYLDRLRAGAEVVPLRVVE